jgi:hypothetical protein
MKTTINNSLSKSISYTEYRDLVARLLAEGKSTSAEDSDALVDYSKLNNSRMKRLDKTVVIPADAIEKIKILTKPVNWIVITEGWCGDAAQNLPVVNKLAELNDNINLRIVLRDENPELMQLFLTNGGMSIPKLIQTDENLEVISDWGPRPSVAADMVIAYREKHGEITAEFKKDLQVWYNKDKGESTVTDMLDFLEL